MISFYILSERLHLKRNRLSDARALSFTKNVVLRHIFWQRFKKSLNSISDD